MTTPAPILPPEKETVSDPTFKITESQFISGLDLGQQQDFSALAVVERTRMTSDIQVKAKVMINGRVEVIEKPRPKNFKEAQWKYAVRSVERFDLGTPYTAISDRLALLYSKDVLAGSVLVPDHTGVGRPVVDMVIRDMTIAQQCFKCAGTGQPSALEINRCYWCKGTGLVKPRCIVRPISITAGAGFSPDGNGFKVAKKDLASCMQVLLQTKRVKIAKIPLRPVLIKEMENFKVKVTSAANESFESWRERDHDDILLAVAMALWVGEHGTQQYWLR